MDTTGFYKNDNGQMMCGPGWVIGPYNSFELRKEQKDTYTYPIDGWYWFDSEEQAYAFFGLDWYPEVYTMGLPKPWLNDLNTTENA